VLAHLALRYNPYLPMTLGIYIQVPFCQAKCTYCNFHTGVVSRDRYEPYTKAICTEISAAPSADGSLDTVYIGGGTPSLLEPSALARILDALRSSFEFVTPETTLEADPETITHEKAAAWQAAGFNRISLGAQSFNDLELQAAGRMHRRTDISSAAGTLRAAGFDNISLDLIAGLPHQTRDSWEQSVTELLEIRPEHVSIYLLEIDEGSRLGKESLAGGARYSAGAIPSDDAMAEFYESACARLAAAGYSHYEISNWALPGRESRHNLKYWRREPYLGLGAGAHSFDGSTRWANVHDSARYVATIEQGSAPREQIERVTPEQALEEEFFLGLRQLEGIDLARIERDYASSSANGTRARFAAIRGQVDALRSQALLIEGEDQRLRIAPAHLTISNSILAELLA
jgi:oxygen-independent coproporphyrinogen-3 oxidase